LTMRIRSQRKNCAPQGHDAFWSRDGKQLTFDLGDLVLARPSLDFHVTPPSA